MSAGRPVYEPLSLARLAPMLAASSDDRRWRLVAEFLEEYRWEPAADRDRLLREEPPSAGHEH